MNYFSSNTIYIVIAIYWSLLFISSAAEEDYSIPFVTRADCLTTDDDDVHQFYDYTQLQCSDCTQNSTEQTVSNDGLSCICVNTYIRKDYEQPDGSFGWMCEPCPIDQVASADGYTCVTCNTGSDCPLCSGNLDLTVERDLDGERFTDALSEPTRTCLTCVDDTAPINTGENRCTRCNDILSVQPNIGCVCLVQTGGMCFRKATDLVDDSPSLYTVNYGNNNEMISVFFYNNIRSSHAACVNFTISDSSRGNSEYSNLTACQLLGNLCVMSLYSQRYAPSEPLNDACSLHMRLVYNYADNEFPVHNPGYRSVYNGIEQWRSSMPWLFYEADSAPQILDDTSISVPFTPGVNLTFIAAKYTLEGSFVEIRNISASDLQVCRDDYERLEKAFEFGLGYLKSCDLLVQTLLDDPDYDLYFYDLFLQYTDNNGEIRLHAVPVLITNYRNKQGELINQDNDRTLWQLTRRFYLVDRVTGWEQDGDGTPVFLRYAKDIVLHIRLQPSGDGLIYPLYLEITYTDVIGDNTAPGDKVQASFRVQYSMDTSSFDTGMGVATGVLCGLAVLIAAMKTFTWNKREGKLVLDFMFLIMFLVYCCGALANAFFMVTYGFSIIWLAFYKGQTIFYMVPDDRGIYYIQAFIGAAFALKSLQMIHLVIHQVTVDIFLVDWEKQQRYDNQDMSLQTLRGHDITDEIAMNLKKDKKSDVSVWRTYFVANEWNDIQTVRRVHPVVHMLLVMMLLYSVGLENITRYETQTNVILPDDSYHGEYNLVFRFAMFTSTFILVALIQRIFYWLLWSRFIQHPINNFVDLCSLTNVSVFIMTQSNFGYYIHGRSPHGHADVGLKQTRINLVREEEDLCGSRGLIPGEDHQTFEVALPNKFRSEYNKVLVAYTMAPAAVVQTPRAATRITVHMEKKIQAYQILNRFIQNYIDHNIKNLTYLVRNKNIVEKALDTETKDSSYHGYFYYDNGHGFEKTLFFGNEFTLQIFEVLFFTVIDMISYNYVLAGVLTYLVDLFIVTLRKGLGKRNVAKKTMVDDRFLI